MMRKEKKFDLSQPENSVKVLDAIVVCLNQYLTHHKDKVINNKSDRSADIETIITSIYDCFDVKMSDEIDSVLSKENLQKVHPLEFPLPSSLMPNKNRDFYECYAVAVTEIKKHKYQTGWILATGNSELKTGIENAIDSTIQNELMAQASYYAEENAQSTLKQVSKFFNDHAQQETFILFYTDNPENTDIYAISPLLTDRLPICFKSRNFIDGKTSVDLKRDNYDVAIERSKKCVLSLANYKPVKPNIERYCFCYHIGLSRENIKKLTAKRDFVGILKNIDGLQVWSEKAKHINTLVNFSVEYDVNSNKFAVNEMRKDIIISK